MKVYIGPYPNYWGPYQIADAIFFWHEKYPKDGLENRWDYKLHDKFAEFLAHGFGDENHNTLFYRFLLWVDTKRKRKMKIRIDSYDTWNMDSTLSPIILPMLKQLKETKHGSGMIDLEDVPEHLRCIDNSEDWCWQQTTFDFYTEENTQKLDIDLHTRYDWVLDEMIWAFQQLCLEDHGEDQFWKKRPEIDFKTYPEDEGQLTVPIRWKEEGECDYDALKKHWERIDNGLRLFGKYYRTLWD